MSKFICTSFGNPQFQYCLECDQLIECLKEKEIREKGEQEE